MEAIPRTGVPRILRNGEEWTQGPKVILAIDYQNGKIIETREEDGREPITLVNPFTPPDDISEQEVINTTTFV